MSSTPLYDVAVIGAGYVGVPLAVTFAEAGQRALVVDVQSNTIDALNRGESHIEDVSNERLAPLVSNGRIVATTDYEQVKQAHAILIAVGTPLSKQREPDLSAIEAVARSLAPVLQRDQVVVLESTTWPGTTREVLQPILEQGSGLKAGEDFRLAMSPERVDPGREDWTTKTTPKVVGGIDPASTKQAADVYRAAIDSVHEVSTPDAAELTKLLENIYRAVNIALVNELAQLCDRMEIDVWEVVDAAKTKPFGFMAFYPGPGLGGHCIPIDPFYLSWKAKQTGFDPRFIELAGHINAGMPHYVVDKVGEALNTRRKAINGSKVLIAGVAYKRDIDDMRESPALDVMGLLLARGADVSYADPFVPQVHGREWSGGYDVKAVEMKRGSIGRYDCVVIVTDHKTFDYAALLDEADVIVDTRNAIKQPHPNVFKLGAPRAPSEGQKVAIV